MSENDSDVDVSGDDDNEVEPKYQTINLKKFMISLNNSNSF